MQKFLGIMMLFLGASAVAMAVNEVPEIDPTSGLSALALIAGGLIAIRGRRKR